ncbi:LOW QUALITY PROTEIN: cytochrome b561 and DOMON domain-containing protein At3g61750 [Aspergillus lentulus]|nr:LOW QUALITY PROTEIN: cytochrome b561 and DOMON domain-containing protein At3g61750 [Aspergillus lentulus]
MNGTVDQSLFSTKSNKMDNKLTRTAYLYSILAFLAQHASNYYAAIIARPASATILYQDLHLVPSYAKAYGILMSVAFILIFPLGATVLRLVKSKHAVWLHFGIQLTGWALMLGGLATGIRLHNNAHTIFGTVIVVLMLIQPFLGVIHHWIYIRKKTRTALAPVHVWLGRILIILGMVNGGLGLRLADNTHGGKIAYGVVAGVCGAMYLAWVVYRLRRRGNGRKEVENVELLGTVE